MSTLSIHRRKPLLGWLSLPLLSAGLLLFSGTEAQTSQSVSAQATPAQRLFDQVNQLVQQNYGGLSTVDRAALAREYQERLNVVCAPVAQTCPAEKAYPVIQAEITALGDRHSFFQTPEDFEDFVTSALGGERLQFGVKLGELDDEQRVVLEVIAGSAAQAAGLQRGDLLRTLDDQPYTYEALHQARLDGRTIRLTLERRGRPLEVTLTPRSTSTRELPSLTYATSGQNGGQENRNIAVLRIPTFLTGGNIAQRVHQLVGEAQRRGATGLVVDLRGDTGGSLEECDSAVSAFVPEFTRVARTSEGDLRTRVSRGLRLEDGRVSGRVSNPQFWTGPLAVLVDRATASCSEFFAFEVQYSARGPVVGEETAGVGNTATRIFPLADKAALQLTVTNYAKPDGTPYPVRVTPDQRREWTEDDMRRLTQGEDTALNDAVAALRTAPSLNASDLR